MKDGGAGGANSQIENNLKRYEKCLKPPECPTSAIAPWGIRLLDMSFPHFLYIESSNPILPPCRRRIAFYTILSRDKSILK